MEDENPFSKTFLKIFDGIINYFRQYKNNSLYFFNVLLKNSRVLDQTICWLRTWFAMSLPPYSNQMSLGKSGLLLYRVGGSKGGLIM